MRTTRRLLCALAATALVLTACGDTSDDAVRSTDEVDSTEATAGRSAAEAVRGASAATAAFDTVTMDMTVEMDGELLMRTSGTGSADGTTGDATVSGQAGEFRMIYVDGNYYYKYPAMPPGIEWVGASAEDLAEASGIDPSAAGGGGLAGTDMLQVLESLSGDVEEIGTEELFGVQTSHYRASLATEDLLAHGTESGLYTEAFANTMRATMPSTFDMEVWIDDDGLPRRQAWSMEFSPTPGAEPSTFEYRIDFAEWGAPLDVAAPPPETVMPIEDYVQAAMPSMLD